MATLFVDPGVLGELNGFFLFSFWDKGCYVMYGYSSQNRYYYFSIFIFGLFSFFGNSDLALNKFPI